MADNLPTSIKNLNTLLGEQLAGGSGGGSMMVVNIHRDFNSPDNNSIDKTFNELKSALQNGVPVYARTLLVQNDTILAIGSVNSVNMQLLAQYGRNDQIIFESTGYTTEEGKITNIATTIFTLLSDDTFTIEESDVSFTGE